MLFLTLDPSITAHFPKNASPNQAFPSKLLLSTKNKSLRDIYNQLGEIVFGERRWDGARGDGAGERRIRPISTQMNQNATLNNYHLIIKWKPSPKSEEEWTIGEVDNLCVKDLLCAEDGHLYLSVGLLQVPGSPSEDTDHEQLSAQQQLQQEVDNEDEQFEESEHVQQQSPPQEPAFRHSTSTFVPADRISYSYSESFSNEMEKKRFQNSFKERKRKRKRPDTPPSSVSSDSLPEEESDGVDDASSQSTTTSTEPTYLDPSSLSRHDFISFKVLELSDKMVPQWISKRGVVESINTQPSGEKEVQVLLDPTAKYESFLLHEIQAIELLRERLQHESSDSSDTSSVSVVSSVEETVEQQTTARDESSDTSQPDTTIFSSGSSKYALFPTMYLRRNGEIILYHGNTEKGHKISVFDSVTSKKPTRVEEIKETFQADGLENVTPREKDFVVINRINSQHFAQIGILCSGTSGNEAIVQLEDRSFTKLPLEAMCKIKARKKSPRRRKKKRQRRG